MIVTIQQKVFYNKCSMLYFYVASWPMKIKSIHIKYFLREKARDREKERQRESKKEGKRETEGKREEERKSEKKRGQEREREGK